MGNWKIGVITDSFRLGVDGGLEAAKAVGADGFQIYVSGGQMHPDTLDAEGRKAFRRKADDLGLEIAALCAEFGKNPSFFDEDRWQLRVELTNRCADLARDLGVGVITSHIGKVPDDQSDPVYARLVEALRAVGDHAESRGVCFGIETGPESPECLRAFIEAVGSGGLKVNYDPANLNSRGFDPVKGVETLAPHIVHTHAKDSVRGKGEVPLGEGEVPWAGYLETLRAHGYEGYLTVERERGEDPRADIKAAVDFLRGF